VDMSAIAGVIAIVVIAQFAGNFLARKVLRR
jgi:hypothetical protein